MVLETVFFEMGDGRLLNKQSPALTHTLSSSASVDPVTYLERVVITVPSVRYARDSGSKFRT